MVERLGRSNDVQWEERPRGPPRPGGDPHADVSEPWWCASLTLSQMTFT